jgi:hypothetical protein
MPVFMCNVTVSYVHPRTGELGSANAGMIQHGLNEETVKERILVPKGYEMQEGLGLVDGEHKFGFAYSCVKLEVDQIQEMLRLASLAKDPVAQVPQNRLN